MNRVNSRGRETWQGLEQRNHPNKKKIKTALQEAPRHCNTHFLALLSFTNAPNCPYVCFFGFVLFFSFCFLKAAVLPSTKNSMIRITIGAIAGH